MYCLDGNQLGFEGFHKLKVCAHTLRKWYWCIPKRVKGRFKVSHTFCGVWKCALCNKRHFKTKKVTLNFELRLHERTFVSSVLLERSSSEDTDLWQHEMKKKIPKTSQLQTFYHHTPADFFSRENKSLKRRGSAQELTVKVALALRSLNSEESKSTRRVFSPVL